MADQVDAHEATTLLDPATFATVGAARLGETETKRGLGTLRATADYDVPVLPAEE